MRIAIFASGSGSNFQAIVDATKENRIKGPICFLFCDKKNAYVIQRAKKAQIPVFNFSPQEFSSKALYERQVLTILKEHKIELVVLAGYMRIIGPTLLQAYKGNIINIHPSFLPDFPGLHVIKAAYQSGVKETGVTIHYVDSGIDTGPIIAQERVPIFPHDTIDILENRIHEVEHHLYPAVLEKLTNHKEEGM